MGSAVVSRRGSFVALVAACALVSSTSGVQSAEASADPAFLPRCDDVAEGTWLAGFIGRFRDSNALAQALSARVGPPAGCEAAETAEWDGLRFGRIELSYDGGVRLTLETMPPETSIVTIESRDGLPGPDDWESVVRDYMARRGYEIDWTSPAEADEGARRALSFRDPEPGLNAAVVLLYEGDRLMAVRISSAL